MLNRLWSKKDITTDIAYLCGNMLNDDDSVVLTHSPYNFALLVFAWAIRDTTPHLDLLSFGLIHLGGVGTYTVIITKRGIPVVQTTCNGCPLVVSPYSKQQEPRR
jgi:hypothetical protein